MGSFVIGIVVTMVTFYIALIYGSTAIGLLGYAEAVLLVLAFCYLLYYRRKISASVHIPIGTAERGDRVRVQLEVSNRSRIPCMRIRYRLRWRHSFQKIAGKRWQEGSPVYPGGQVCEAAAVLPWAGNYTVTLEKIRLYDLTGFFYMNRSVQQCASLQVLPEVCSVNLRVSEATRTFFGDSDVYDDFRPGNDRSEIFDVREFRAGDKIQSIHWKLSAKSEELMVREDSQPLACPVVLILDREGLSARSGQRFLSVAASLMFSMMDSGCPHYVAWYSESRKDMVRARVDDEEGYYIALCSYMEEDSCQPRLSPKQLYREKYRSEYVLHTLLLKGDLTLELDEKPLAKPENSDWKAYLEKLELIL